jgi:hypothetical protein
MQGRRQGSPGASITPPLRSPRERVRAPPNPSHRQRSGSALQYYSVAVGNVTGGVAVSGGLQDNGGSLLLPEDLTGSGKMGIAVRRRRRRHAGRSEQRLPHRAGVRLPRDVGDRDLRPLGRDRPRCSRHRSPRSVPAIHRAWSRLGSNLPYTATLDIHCGPDAQIYAATHGRGIWSIAEVAASTSGRTTKKAP